MSDDEREPKISADMLVAVSAVFIGVCALVVSLYEANLMRAEQRSAVLPILELSRSYYVNEDRPDGEWRLDLQAENVGIGPAQVLDFRVTVDGVSQPTWSAAMSALLRRNTEVRFGQSTINGRTIPAERMVTMFSLSSTELASEIVENFDRLEFEACFCSVFDECWTTSYTAFGAPTPVEACTPGDGSFQQ